MISPLYASLDLTKTDEWMNSSCDTTLENDTEEEETGDVLKVTDVAAEHS